MGAGTCQRCGSPLPAEARFCPTCGAPVLLGTGDEERKVVTILFADLADSTALAASIDPERFRTLQSEFYRLASSEVAAFRGRPEKFAGDAVMAVFGLPHAHEDDAMRGLHAGLHIRDRMAELGERLALRTPLRVRVGVSSGPVIASPGGQGELLVSGAEVNVAARLQQAAAPGEVLAGDTTWQLAHHAADFGEPREIAAKGLPAPIEGYPVEGISARSARRTIPLVGRARDVELLLGAAHRSAETGRAHLVTIVGEPGIGKTRLVQELTASVPEGTEVLLGRASEFGEDMVFAPLADMVRRRLGVGTETDQAEVRKRLEEAVEECCDISEVDQVAARLGLLLGLGDERPASPYRYAEIRAGLVTFLSRLARNGPVVVVLEDLHLARTALLEVVEETLREARRVPLTVVAVGRESLLRSHPDWGKGVADALVLRLEPLSHEEGRRLAEVAAESIPPSMADVIARQAGGNPFFIVETTGVLVHERERHGDMAARPVLAPTVQAIVAARIDHLQEPARRLIRVASIFPGAAFQESRLALVEDADPDVLRSLEEEELIVPDDDRPGRWRFRHELLREVAYESLSKRDRRQLHERVAAGTEAMDDPDRHAQQIAYHLECAARDALDLDPNDREPCARAVAALARAGDLARWRMESRVAIDLYERGLAMSSEDSWGVLEARMLAGMGEARYWLGEYEEAEARLLRALEVGRDDAWTRSLALRFVADIALNVHGDPSRAEQLFDEALEAARALDNRWAVARTLLMAGWVPYWSDDLDGARMRFEEALAVARANPDGDRWAEARALNSLVSVVAPVEHVDEAMRLADRAQDLGREMEDAFTIAVADENRGTTLRRMMKLDRALAAHDAAIRTYRELGARWEIASALGERGLISRLLGRLDAAEEDLREALALCVDLGERALVGWTLSELAYVRLLRGDVTGARATLDESAIPGSDLPGARTSLVGMQALVSLAEGDEELGRKLALQGLEDERARAGRSAPNWLASETWWTGRVFGPDAVGGEEALEAARRRLEEVGWEWALREPEVALKALGR